MRLNDYRYRCLPVAADRTDARANVVGRKHSPRSMGTRNGRAAAKSLAPENIRQRLALLRDLSRRVPTRDRGHYPRLGLRACAPVGSIRLRGAMITYYILDGKTPVPMADQDGWRQFMQNGNRDVATTAIG